MLTEVGIFVGGSAAGILLLLVVASLFNKKPPKTDIAPPREANTLFGYDLDKWHFLGTKDLKWNDTAVITPVFFFVSKDDPHLEKRGIYVAGPHAKTVYDRHSWFLKYILPWSIGEGYIWTYIDKPSDFLKDYMLSEYQHEWSIEKNWWATSEQVQYDSAKAKQTREKKTKNKTSVIKEDSNIITVEFGKAKKNDN